VQRILLFKNLEGKFKHDIYVDVPSSNAERSWQDEMGDWLHRIVVCEPAATIHELMMYQLLV
jgi:hypothetical protein